MLAVSGKQRGDTIVEVLIAIVVVSMVLVAAYVTTTRNVDGMQDTQEHNEALQLAQAQLEYLHNAATQPTDHHCFRQSDGSIQSGSDCVVDAGGCPIGTCSPTGTQPQFTLDISQTAASIPAVQPTFEIAVTWSALQQGGQQNRVNLFYQP